MGEKFSIEEVCKHLEISEASGHRWQAQYGGMKSDDANGGKSSNVRTPG
ncbi:transposase [Nocardia sp. NBC_00511]